MQRGLDVAQGISICVIRIISGAGGSNEGMHVASHPRKRLNGKPSQPYVRAVSEGTPRNVSRHHCTPIL